jgi:hypothetical protein
LLRWVGLLVLLVAEVMFLTFRFDTGTLGDETATWAQLLGRTPLALRLGITVATVTLLVCGRCWWQEVNQSWEEVGASYCWWPFLLGHLAAFAALTWTTALVLKDAIAVSPFPMDWVGVWATVVAATLVFWGLSVLPAGLWLRLIQRGRIGLLAAVVGGLAAALVAGCMTWLWEPLGQGTLEVVHALLRLVYAETVYQPAEFAVGTPAFAVRIAPECSGYEGIGLIEIFLGISLWLFRNTTRFPQAWLLLPLGGRLSG